MKKILLVDDDSNYIWLLKNFLQRKGYEVITACSGDNAFKKNSSTISFFVMS